MAERPEVAAANRQASEDAFSLDDVRRLGPRVNLLSNGRMFSLVTAAGSGFVGLEGIMLNRWQSDATLEQDGYFLFLRDKADGRLWSAGLQPIPDGATSYRATFREGLARFDRAEAGIRSVLEIFVSARTDVEFRVLRLRNESSQPREIEVISFLEIALNTQEADLGHPAFSKLFVQTTYDPRQHAIRAWRRPRSPEETPSLLFHAASGGGAPSRFETSRPHFLGRGGSARRPASLFGATPEPDRVTGPNGSGGQSGSVLDPVASLGRSVSLKPGEEATITFTLGGAQNQSDLEELLTALTTADLDLASEREAAAATESARRSLHGLLEEDAPMLRRIAGSLFYFDHGLRSTDTTGTHAPLERLRTYGLAQDRPFLVPEGDAPEAVDRARRIHGFMQASGLRVDLLYPPDAADPRCSSDGALLRTAASAHVCTAPVEEEPAPTALPHRPFAKPSRGPADGPSVAQSGEALRFHNGYGGFTEDGRTYVIQMPPDASGRPQLPPQPWTNVIANPDFGFLVSESGAGCTWSRNSRQNRLTPWPNDPVSDPHTEALYLRDEEAGRYWSPLPGPAPAGAYYEARHGLGHTTFRHTSNELDQTVTHFVACDAPVRITMVQLTNLAERPRTLSLFAYHEWVLGSRADLSRPFLRVGWDKKRRAIVAHNPFNDEFGGGRAFAAMRSKSGEVRYETDRAAFLGRLGDRAHPHALATEESLSGQESPGADPCAALQLQITLAPGETQTSAVLVGEAGDEAELAALCQRFSRPDAWKTALDAVNEFWSAKTEALRIETPSPKIDVLVNGWLPYQNLSCRIWGRTAFYQSGGAFGFRDQLQDAAGLIYVDPALTRAQILLHAANQFVEGDVMHWWHPPTGKGIRTRFSDDLLWLPYITTFYVATTGDHPVLDEVIPYLTARLLEEGEDEVFLQPEPSGEAASLYDHCCRAIDRSLRTGVHGLPLMGTGDWNDGMNRVGRQGRGESVWMGFFLYHILSRFIPICEARGDGGRVNRYVSHRDRLRDALNGDGWDGNWYRRAFYDDGAVLGSSESDEARIDALSQAWAVISGAAPRERVQRALDALERELVDEEAGIIRLLTPAFDQTPHDPGYIKGYIPGVRENGGQYTHGVLWAIRALAEADRGDRAAALLEMLTPISHSDTRARAERYRVEPYVVAADVYGEPPHVGRGGWTWYTGSAAWMYRVAVESILGLRLEEGRVLRVQPSIPPEWKRYSITIRLPQSGTVYEIDVQNPDARSSGVRKVTVDGIDVPVEEDEIARVRIQHDKLRYHVRVTM